MLGRRKYPQYWKNNKFHDHIDFEICRYFNKFTKIQQIVKDYYHVILRQI